MAYPGVYLVPPSRTCAFYREGRFSVSAPLVWSYLHTHPLWVEEMALYANASADGMALASSRSLLRPSLREGLDAAQATALLSRAMCSVWNGPAPEISTYEIMLAMTSPGFEQLVQQVLSVVTTAESAIGGGATSTTAAAAATATSGGSGQSD